MKKTAKQFIPTEEGFYWATSIQRRKSFRFPDGGQIGGLRWIVRVFKSVKEEHLQVQVFGDSDRLMDLRDYKDYEGPIGIWHMMKETK